MPIEATSDRAGRYISQPTGYKAFVPAPLPPAPPLQFDGEMLCLHEQATAKLGRLEGLTINLPSPKLFLSMYVRKEAVLSSQIEGTQASLDDVLEYEVQQPRHAVGNDAAGVVNYVRAMDYGLERLKTLPLSLHLLREIHAELLAGVRGGEPTKSPGEFRRTQNWIGHEGSNLNQAVFVPPPPNEMMDALHDLERYLHTSPTLPLLVRCALVHAQFETIHPFLDGNGRVGRLLITFLLCHAGMLRQPLLYLSYFFKANREEYYARLNSVRMAGDWEGWLRFFLRGVADVADQAAQTAEKILSLRKEHLGVIYKAYPRAASNAVRLLDSLFERPYVAASWIVENLGVSAPTAHSLLTKFQDNRILLELTGRSYGRVYRYEPYVALLREGTEV